MTHKPPTDGNSPDEIPSPEARALYRRWRAAMPSAAHVRLEPSDLAAWIDSGLDAAELRVPLHAEIASPAFLARAQALIAADGEAHSASVLPFDRSRHPARKPSQPARTGSRSWVAVGAVAASLAIVSMAGFGMGVTLGQQIMPDPIQNTGQHTGSGTFSPEPGTLDDGIG